MQFTTSPRSQRHCHIGRPELWFHYLPLTGPQPGGEVHVRSCRSTTWNLQKQQQCHCPQPRRHTFEKDILGHSWLWARMRTSATENEWRGQFDPQHHKRAWIEQDQIVCKHVNVAVKYQLIKTNEKAHFRNPTLAGLQHLDWITVITPNVSLALLIRCDLRMGSEGPVLNKKSP